MNGWLRRALYCRLSTLRGRIRGISSTPLTDILSTERVVGPDDAPFIRRALAMTNLPPQIKLEYLLDRVHTGPLESAELIAAPENSEPPRAHLSFLSGTAAARFLTSSSSLNFSGHQLACAWLPYRPLDPVVGAAVARDRARRALFLYKSRERQDRWEAPQLQAYLEFAGAGHVEQVVVQQVGEDKGYNEVAVVHFADIASAIRAHARIRADPAMLQVHVAYGTDRCEAPPPSLAAIDEALEQEPRHAPTYFPAAAGIQSPFTTLALSTLPPNTTLHNLCDCVYGGPLYSIELREDNTAEISFFRTEDARDFYAGTQAHPFTIFGQEIAVTPQPAALITPQPIDYTRVLSVRVFHSQGLPHAQLREDFGVFGTLVRVRQHSYVFLLLLLAPPFSSSSFPPPSSAPYSPFLHPSFFPVPSLLFRLITNRTQPLRK
ncbi:hypothetical protein C8R44DRAFT_855262, partial [Mycena epipterygia]